MMAGQLAHQVCVIFPWRNLFVPAPGRWVGKHHSIPYCIHASLKPCVLTWWATGICCNSVVGLMVCCTATTFKWQCLNICYSEQPSLKLFVSKHPGCFHSSQWKKKILVSLYLEVHVSMMSANDSKSSYVTPVFACSPYSSGLCGEGSLGGGPYPWGEVPSEGHYDHHWRAAILLTGWESHVPAVGCRCYQHDNGSGSGAGQGGWPVLC